jgi:hypothetical protein
MLFADLSIAPFSWLLLLVSDLSFLDSLASYLFDSAPINCYSFADLLKGIESDEMPEMPI